MKTRAAVLAMALVSAGCSAQSSRPVDSAALFEVKTNAEGLKFLLSRVRPWPRPDSPGTLAITEPSTGRVAVYDSALVALVLLRSGRRDEAGRIIVGLAALQDEDGSLPFSFVLPAPERGSKYVRSGALAWAGYAAAEYLDAESGGSAREAAALLGHRAARYLLGRQLANDARDGLVSGGTGTFRYSFVQGKPREVLVPGNIEWASVEHNIDSYFFLRAFGRITGTEAYSAAAERIARALLQRGWAADNGQMVRGFTASAPDPVKALDCASWGAVFLQAAGAKERAITAAAVADAAYGSFDRRSGAHGHRAYASGPLLEDASLREHFGPSLPAPTWDKLSAIWPEGSAGVALAALRAGRAERAKAILAELEPLREKDGSFPTLTVDVPFEFDTRPSIAGTAWVELVRFEIGRPEARATFWAP